MSKLIIPNLPSYYRLDDIPSFDTWTQRSLVVEITTGQNTNLNRPSAIRFEYKGEDYARLGSPRSGFRVRANLTTMAGNPLANARTAQITLASNWFFHLFSKIELKAGSETLEMMDKPGECIDIMCHLKGLDFRQRSGEDIGFIPDEGPATATANLAVAAHTNIVNPGADTAADIGTTANAAATAAIAAVRTALAGNYNHGYRRRFDKYNYDVAGNDDPREIELFIPNSILFSYCDTYDMVTKFMPFTVELTRRDATDVNNAIFGAAANTSMTIELQELTWIVDTYEPKPELALTLDKRFEKGPLSVNYLHRYISSVTSDQQVVRISETQFSQPRYIFITCKGTTGAASQIGPDRNYSLCRNCDIKEIQVSLDSKWYPDKSYNAEFSKNYFSHFYDAYASICETFSGSCGITPKEFKELYTIFCIDLNDQKDKLQNSATNMSIVITRRARPVNDNDPNNPLNVEYFYMVLDEAHYAMDCVKKTCIKV